MFKSHFKYKFTEDGFVRREKIKKIVGNFFKISIFVIIMIPFFQLVSSITAKVIFGGYITFLALFMIYHIYLIVKTINTKCEFDFNKKVVTYKYSDINKFDISEFKTLIYSARVKPKKYEAPSLVQLRLMKIPLLYVNDMGRNTYVYPYNNRDKHDKEEISTTSKYFKNSKTIGFYLYNEKTKQVIYLMDSDSKKVQETYEYIILNIKPTMLISIINTNSGFKFKETQIINI